MHGTSAQPVRVLDSVDFGLQAQLARAVTESYVAQSTSTGCPSPRPSRRGAAETDVTELAAKTALLRLPEEVRAQGLPDAPMKAISYFGPSMDMFFVLFTVGFGARSHFVEQQGTLDRIAAVPVGRVRC